jgi:hypothetical protein
MPTTAACISLDQTSKLPAHSCKNQSTTSADGPQRQDSFSPPQSANPFYSIDRTQILEIKMQGNTLPNAKSIRLLGLTFDHKLNWKEHIKKLKATSSQ